MIILGIDRKDAIRKVSEEKVADRLNRKQEQERTMQGSAAQDGAVQGGAGQGRAEESRSGQDRAEQVRTGRGRAGQKRAGQVRTEQSRSGQGGTGRGRREQVRSGQCRTDHLPSLGVAWAPGCPEPGSSPLTSGQPGRCRVTPVTVKIASRRGGGGVRTRDTAPSAAKHNRIIPDLGGGRRGGAPEPVIRPYRAGNSW